MGDIPQAIGRTGVLAGCLHTAGRAERGKGGTR